MEGALGALQFLGSEKDLPTGSLNYLWAAGGLGRTTDLSLE